MAQDTPTEELDAIARGVDGAFDAARDDNDLRQVTSRFTGREGSLTRIMKRIPELPGAERKVFGQRVNEVKSLVERAQAAAVERLRREARERELAGPALDVTLPGRRPRLGRVHPIMRTLHEIIDVFTALGF